MRTQGRRERRVSWPTTAAKAKLKFRARRGSAKLPEAYSAFGVPADRQFSSIAKKTTSVSETTTATGHGLQPTLLLGLQ